MSDRKSGRRLAQVFGWLLGSSMAAAAAAGPALAEAQVQAQLRERFAVDEHFAIDLDLAGLELRGLSRPLPDGRGRVTIDRVRVRPGFEGLRVDIEGLDARVSRARPKQAATQSSPSAAASAARAPRARRQAGADPIARMLQRLRGVPIEVVIDGTVTLELGDGLLAIASDPRLELPGDGRITTDAAVELSLLRSSPSLQRSPPSLQRSTLPDGHGQTVRETWASASLRIETSDTDLRDVQVDGRVSFEHTTLARSLMISAHATPEQIDVELREVELRDRKGGRADMIVERDATDGRDHARLIADDLPLKLLEPLAQLLGRRLGDAIGEREGELDLDDARISGAIELVRGAGLTRARFDELEVSDVRLDSPLLSAKPIELGSVTIDGELAREHGPHGPRSFGAVVLAHRGVQLQLSGQLDAARLRFEMQLPTTSCQALLDATPGISPVLAGSVLSGQLDGALELELDFAALERARARYLGDQAETLELEHFDAPGQLHFALPFLERCTIERLGPGADVEGLRGAYHHRFVSAAGGARVSQRVLAVGDRDYVAIDEVPKLALAFVILEDARFWEHDGFDREQIERAFWFNLLEGRVSRGASTISQQTARSLWLGIDRSITRKLAEAVLAAELERGLDKQRILEVYLNIIELGPEVHGIVEASHYHFGKHPSELSLLEALHLASMAPAPVAYARRFASGRVDRQWREHLHQQVRRLRIRHLITRSQADAALHTRLQLRSHPELAAR